MKILLIGALLALSACGVNGSSDESTKTRAKAEEEAVTDVQNKNNAQKAARMERELMARHSYYQAIAGKYEGDIATNAGTYKMRITLVPSILPYRGERVRELSEIETDLNNLYFYVQVVQWHPNSEATAVGCRISGIRPNMNEGYMVVGSSECSNLYQVFLSDGGRDANRRGSPEDIAKSISNQIQNGHMTRVNRLTGSIQPSSSAAVYTFDTLRRD